MLFSDWTGGVEMGGACGKSSKDSESQRRSRFLSPESLPGPAGIQRALGTWSTSGSFPYRSIRFSTEAPSTHHKLLMQSLLKNEALAISAIDYLPSASSFSF
jgi:hypothetical protein